MATLIVKLLQEKLKLIFKRFDKSNLNSQILKGKLQLSNLEFNESVIQNFLGINRLRVKDAKVDKLEVNVSITKLKTMPAVATIGHMFIILEEPDQYLTRRPRLAVLEAQSAYKANWANTWLENMTIRIGKVTIVIRLKGAKGQEKPPELHIHLEGIRLDGTDAQWRVVELPQLIAGNKGKSISSSYRRGTITSLSAQLVNVATPNKAGATHTVTLFQIVGPVLRLHMRKSAATGLMVGVECEVELERIEMTLGAADFGALMHLVEAASWTYYRTYDDDELYNQYLAMLERQSASNSRMSRDLSALGAMLDAGEEEEAAAALNTEILYGPMPLTDFRINVVVSLSMLHLRVGGVATETGAVSPYVFAIDVGNFVLRADNAIRVALNTDDFEVIGDTTPTAELDASGDLNVPTSSALHLEAPTIENLLDRAATQRQLSSPLVKSIRSTPSRRSLRSVALASAAASSQPSTPSSSSKSRKGSSPRQSKSAVRFNRFEKWVPESPYEMKTDVRIKVASVSLHCLGPETETTAMLSLLPIEPKGDAKESGGFFVAHGTGVQRRTQGSAVAVQVRHVIHDDLSMSIDVQVDVGAVDANVEAYRFDEFGKALTVRVPLLPPGEPPMDGYALQALHLRVDVPIVTARIFADARSAHIARQRGDVIGLPALRVQMERFAIELTDDDTQRPLHVAWALSGVADAQPWPPAFDEAGKYEPRGNCLWMRGTMSSLRVAIEVHQCARVAPNSWRLGPSQSKRSVGWIRKPLTVSVAVCVGQWRNAFNWLLDRIDETGTVAPLRRAAYMLDKPYALSHLVPQMALNCNRQRALVGIGTCQVLLQQLELKWHVYAYEQLCAFVESFSSPREIHADHDEVEGNSSSATAGVAVDTAGETSTATSIVVTESSAPASSSSTLDDELIVPVPLMFGIDVRVHHVYVTLSAPRAQSMHLVPVHAARLARTRTVFGQRSTDLRIVDVMVSVLHASVMVAPNDMITCLPLLGVPYVRAVDVGIYGLHLDSRLADMGVPLGIRVRPAARQNLEAVASLIASNSQANFDLEDSDVAEETINGGGEKSEQSDAAVSAADSEAAPTNAGASSNSKEARRALGVEQATELEAHAALAHAIRVSIVHSTHSDRAAAGNVYLTAMSVSVQMEHADNSAPSTTSTVLSDETITPFLTAENVASINGFVSALRSDAARAVQDDVAPRESPPMLPIVWRLHPAETLFALYDNDGHLLDDRFYIDETLLPLNDAVVGMEMGARNDTAHSESCVDRALFDTAIQLLQDEHGRRERQYQFELSQQRKETEQTRMALMMTQEQVQQLATENHRLSFSHSARRAGATSSRSNDTIEQLHEMVQTMSVEISEHAQTERQMMKRERNLMLENDRLQQRIAELETRLEEVQGDIGGADGIAEARRREIESIAQDAGRDIVERRHSFHVHRE